MTEARSRHGRSLARARAAFVGIALAVLVVDQLVKAWIDASFPLAALRERDGSLADPTPIVGDLVRIAKTYNEGGLFGLFGGAAPLFAAASILVIAGIVLYGLRAAERESPLLTVTLGLLLGGALGNLVDRLRFGHVIDFVDMGIGAWRWYTFNVADAAISTAIVGLVAVSFIGDRPLRAILRRPPATAAPDPSAGGR